MMGDGINDVLVFVSVDVVVVVGNVIDVVKMVVDVILLGDSFLFVL